MSKIKFIHSFIHSIIPELGILEQRMRKWQVYMVPRLNVINIWMKWAEIFCIDKEIDTVLGRQKSWVDVRDLSHVLGADISLPPAWSGAGTGSGADWYLKVSSQYKRSAGRNFGDTRHGTPL